MESRPIYDPQIITVRELAVPRELVFAAFSDPAALAAWWGPNGFTNDFEEFDFRPGGTWRFVMRTPDGSGILNECRFLEIVAPGRIVFHHPGPTHEYWATFEFAARGSGTLLTWKMLHSSAVQCEQLRPFIEPANEQNLDRLEELLLTG